MSPIDFEAERRKRMPDYIDRCRVIDLADALDSEAAAVTRGSMDAFGAVDPIAYEMTAFANALRRMMETSK